MTATKKKAQGGVQGKREVNHSLIAWALSGVLWYAPESRDARRIMEAASALGGATGNTSHDFRPKFMLHILMDAHTSCAYDLEGQDRGKGRRAYQKLVALAGGPEGAPEPKDRDSCAWWCWTMRRIRADFYTDPGPSGSEQEAASFRRYFAAWREVDSLAFGVFGGSEARTGVNYALACLPALVKAKQWEEHWKREKGGKQ
ncbi:MAG TPA: hypothetical protein VF621_10195 [Pyrinomonadaceae bacterium]|jgi:hypothetical protein